MRPSNKWLQFSVSFSGYHCSKLKLSILANKLVLCGVISVEKVNLKDLVGSHFPLNQDTPPPTITARYQRRRMRRVGCEGGLGGGGRVGLTITKCQILGFWDG